MCGKGVSGSVIDKYDIWGGKAVDGRGGLFLCEG